MNEDPVNADGSSSLDALLSHMDVLKEECSQKMEKLQQLKAILLHYSNSEMDLNKARDQAKEEFTVLAQQWYTKRRAAL